MYSKLIENADEMEREQWAAFENSFRQYHEETLPYRFLPENDEERAIVEKAFPPISITGKKGTVEFDYDRVMFSGWPHAIRYAGIAKCIMDNNKGTLTIQIVGVGKQKLPISSFGSRKDEVLQIFNRYYTRYLHAAAYQEQKKLKMKAGEVVGPK